MLKQIRSLKEMIGARNTADGMIHATKKSMADAGDKLTDEEKAPVEAAISGLEEALKGDDKDEITVKTTALTEASAKIAEKLLQPQMPVRMRLIQVQIQILQNKMMMLSMLSLKK